MKVTFFDLLGIGQNIADRAGAAKALWPSKFASLTQGLPSNDDSLTIVNNLQQGLTFTNVRPGVDPNANFQSVKGQIAFAADMAVSGAPATAQPFYLASLPDIGIQLVPTDPSHPATIFFASDGRGYELIVDKLPVKIFLKEGTASALGNAPVTLGTFDSSAIDSFSYTLNADTDPTELDVFIRLQITTAGDIIIEPTVPMSLGPCRWLGIPAKAVYDILLIPSPNRRDYYEWAHNDLDSFISNPPVKGAIGFRSIDVDLSQSPLSDLASRLQTGAVNINNLELVVEDVVVPLFGIFGAIPSHGTFGIRRKITDRSDINQAYSFSGAPLQIPLYSSNSQGGNGGTSLMLEVDDFFFQTGDVNAVEPMDQPQVQFQTALIYQGSGGPKFGPQVGVDAEWLLYGGLVVDPTNSPATVTIAGANIGVAGVKFGVSLSRLGQKMKFSDSFELLGDLFISSKTSTAGGGLDDIFQITSLTGKPLQVVIRDLGFKLGNVSLDGLQMPNGMQLIFAKVVHVIVEEMGWVEEPNGTPYFSFSGGVAFGPSGGQPSNPSGNSPAQSNGGFGLRVLRLRFRLNDDGSQPPIKLDGIFLNLNYGPVSVAGFGYISNYTDTGWTVNEWGFGVSVKLNLGFATFQLAAEFVKGSRQNISDPSQQFGYFLAALQLSYLPAGPFALYDIRALVADNMAPNLDSTFPDGEGMALLKWHQDHDSALSFPANRTLADWIAQDDAFSIGVGTGFSINGAGAAMHIDGFIFFSKSDADTGILIVGELYLLKNPKPSAFVAVEYDISSGKFGVMIGVSMNLRDFTSGNVPSWLANIATLTGSMYFGNEPWTFAIGQLADQSSWLSLKVNINAWIVVEKSLFALCVQIVDGGPKGFAVVIQFTASSAAGIGQFILFGSFGFIMGTWKTGSDSSGLEFWIQVGFKINLFWVFSFGAEIGVKITYLGKQPWYTTAHFEVRIDTPWFLPDVTFSFDKTWQSPQPFDTATLSQGLSTASGIDPTQSQEQGLLVPGLTDGRNDPTYIYTFNQLNGLNGVRIADPHTQDIPIVSVDATIAVNFTQPLSNDSEIATTTYNGTTDTGVQKVQDFTARYGLQSIAIRRAPRFGPTAGQWSDFVTDVQTQFSVGGSAPEYITFAWDVDSRADGQLSPKRLLVNSSSPYSFATSAPQDDEEATRNDADFPCCNEEARRKLYPHSQRVSFSALSPGSRAPASQQFDGTNASWWKWDVAPMPTITLGWPAYPSTNVARIMPRSSIIIAHVDFNTPAASANAALQWDNFPGTLFLEGYLDLSLVAQQAVDLHSASSTTVALTLSGAATASGMTRMIVRVALDPLAAFEDPSILVPQQGYAGYAGIEFAYVSYVTVASVDAYIAAVQRCPNGSNVGPPGSDASGKLAFLPNHDYEIVVTSAIDLGTVSQGTRSLSLSEALYFRTKGLPGLNACPNIGDDIRLHVDTTYPIQRAYLIYRTEPCVLAFQNSLSSILPIDRNPGPSDPPEKAQMFPLELNVDRIVSLSGLQRLTVPSNDWIAAHRPNPHPLSIVPAIPGFAEAKVRYGPSTDALVARYETVKSASVATCGAPDLDHASQVLLHEPIDPTGAAGPWEPQTGYRATVRQQDGPFAEVSGFDVYDAQAFIFQADGGAAATAWSVDNSGNLIAPSSGAGRSYASCGDLDWDHFQIQSRIDLRAANAAGIAVGVGGGTPVPQGVLCTIEIDGGGHALVVRSLFGSTETELGRAAITLNGPSLLTVIVYDDVVRAIVGSVSVDGTRNAIREGRAALVAQGAAAFAGIAVSALDIYSFEFIASKYNSFSEHLSSYDGTLPALVAGGFGGIPASIASVYTANQPAIDPVMQASSDPQARQKLFDSILRQLVVGLRKDRLNVKVSRLADTTGTFGFLLESPEPISLTRDVKLTLTQRIREWISSPVVKAPRLHPVLDQSSIATSALAGLFSDLSSPANTTTSSAVRMIPDALAALQFFADAVSVPAALAQYALGDRILRVIEGASGNQVQIFGAPQPNSMSGSAVGPLLETLTVSEASKRLGSSAIANFVPGTTAVVSAGGTIGPILDGHLVTTEVPVPITVLSDGAETSILILSKNAQPLGPGIYTLLAVLDRDRWSASTQADPEQHYHDQQTLTLLW